MIAPTGTAPPDVFHAHWRALKAHFDTHAPPWISRFFAGLPTADASMIERLVIEGKTARGCLTCLVCEALGGTLADALPRAVAIECIQAATLVHDDFVDGDAIRRERPAVWTVLGPRRAVLLGDLMFATALVQGARLGLADVSTLAEAVATVAAGAYHEGLSALHPGVKTPDRGGSTLYERVIHCKTGALFGAAGKLGAIAAGATPLHLAAASAFATRIGEAYQMADDAHDVLGASNATHAGGFSLQQDAALAAISAHLIAIESLNGGTSERNGNEASRGTGAELRPRMMKEINRRLALARLELSGFPAGSSGSLLHAAPAFIVNLQGVG